jgi:hypothetical protein
MKWEKRPFKMFFLFFPFFFFSFAQNAVDLGRAAAGGGAVVDEPGAVPVIFRVPHANILLIKDINALVLVASVRDRLRRGRAVSGSHVLFPRDCGVA